MARPKADHPPLAAILALADAKGQLAMRVIPGARSDAVAIEGGLIVIRTRAKPQDGAANEAVLKLLAAALGCAPSALTLLRGATSRHKLVRIAC